MANTNQTLALAVLLMLPIFGSALSIMQTETWVGDTLQCRINVSEAVALEKLWMKLITNNVTVKMISFHVWDDDNGTRGNELARTADIRTVEVSDGTWGNWGWIKNYEGVPHYYGWHEGNLNAKLDKGYYWIGVAYDAPCTAAGCSVVNTGVTNDGDPNTYAAYYTPDWANFTHNVTYKEWDCMYKLNPAAPVENKITLSAWLDKSVYQLGERMAVYAKVVDADGTSAIPEEGTAVTAAQPYPCPADALCKPSPSAMLAYDMQSGIYKTDNFIAQETSKDIIVRATKGSAEISQTLTYSISGAVHDVGITSLEMPRQITSGEPLAVAGTVKNFGSAYEKVTLTLSVHPVAVALQQTAAKQIAPITGTATAATAAVVVSSSASTMTEGGASAQIQTLELQPGEERRFGFKAGPLAAGEYEAAVYASVEGDANSANNRASGIVSVVTAQQPLLISDAKLDKVTYTAGDEMRIKARVLFADGTPATPQAGTVVWANIIGYMLTASTAQTQQTIAAVQTQTVVSQQEKTEYIPPLRDVALQYNQDTQAYEGTLKAPSNAGSYSVIISATAKEYRKATAYLPFIVSGSALHDVGIGIEPIRGVQAGSAFEVRGTLTNHGASKESVTVLLRITSMPLCRSEVCPAVVIPIVYETKTTVEIGPNEKRPVAFPVGPLGAGAYFAQLDARSEADQNRNNDFADMKFEVTGAVPSRKIALQKGWNMFSIPIASSGSAAELLKSCEVTSKVWHYGVGIEDTTKRGYVATDYVTPGLGYWVRIASPCTIEVSGGDVDESFLPQLYAGWNQIGALSKPVLFDEVHGDCKIKSGPWRYNAAGKYEKAETLLPGEGYWVKAESACRLGGSPPLPPEGMAVKSIVKAA